MSNIIDIVARQEEAQLLLEAYERLLVTEDANTATTNNNDNENPNHNAATTMTPLECVWISGHSGTGKTVLAHSLLPHVIVNETPTHDVHHHRHHGFFLSGKFELTSKLQDPFAVFAAAFAQLVDSLLLHQQPQQHAQQQRLNQIRTVVQETLDGCEKSYLVHVIPSLKLLLFPDADKEQEREIGGNDDDGNARQQPQQQRLVAAAASATPVVDIKNTDAILLFQLAFCKFCRSLSTVAPLVFFLDDLQWSDTSSLDLLKVLLETPSNPQQQQRHISPRLRQSQSNHHYNNSNSKIMLILAFRDEEIYDNTHKSDTSKGMQLPFWNYLRSFQFLSQVPTNNLSAKSSSPHYRQQQPSIRLTKIHLDSMDEASIHQLVANYLHLPLSSSLSLSSSANHNSTANLAKIIHSKSGGNPFFAIEMLKLLIAQGHIVPVVGNGAAITKEENDDYVWQWNHEDIVRACSSNETVDELVRHTFRALPRLSQQVLQVAACMGDDMDESAICTVLGMEIPECEMHIQAGQQPKQKQQLKRKVGGGGSGGDGDNDEEGDEEVHDEEQQLRTGGGGLVEYQRHLGRFRFRHDRIRQVILSTIDDKDAMMYHVGYLLWTKASPIFLSTKIFLVTSLLNYGINVMTDQEERYRAAALNLEAGIKAAAYSAFPDSSRYLAAGMEFLKRRVDDGNRDMNEGGEEGDSCSYWKDRYELTLNLISTAADTEVCTQNFDRVTELLHEVLQHGRTVHDKLRVYAAQINSLGQRGMLQEAIEYGVHVLHQLGQPLPQKATMMAVVVEVIKTKIALRGLSEETLMMLLPMSDPTKLAAVHFMSILLPYTFQAASNYDPVLGTRIARMCMKYGYHKACVSGFTTFGWLLCVTGNRKEGYRLGCLALSKIKASRSKEMIARVFVSFYGFINHWRNPARTSLEPLERAVKIGMEVGDIEYAMMALNFKVTTYMSCGEPLPQLEEMMVDASQKMKYYKQNSMLESLSVCLQYIHNLTGRAPDRLILDGEILEAASFNLSMSSRVSWICHHFLSAFLAFYFGELQLALHLSKERQKLSFKPSSLLFYPILRQLDALVAIANARIDTRCRRYAYKVGRQILAEMKGWASDSPENFSFRFKIVKAELQSLKHHKHVDPRIYDCYQQAIDEATKEGYLAEPAIYNDLLGDYVNRQGGDINLVRHHWQEAYSFFLRWGATEKAAYLLERRNLMGAT